MNFASKPFSDHSLERNLSSSGTSNPGICRIAIFERNPCMKCYQDSSQQATVQSISDAKSSVKFNEQAQVCKLKTPMQIKEVILSISDVNKGKKYLAFARLLIRIIVLIIILYFRRYQ